MIKLLTLLAALTCTQSVWSAPAPAPASPPASPPASMHPTASSPAAHTPPSHENDKEPAIPHSEAGNYQQVIEEYKAYVATVDKSVRDEIVGFRKDMAKLNKQKHTVYKKLSQEAQHYLAKERELKRKLPLDQRKAFKDQTADDTKTE